MTSRNAWPEVNICASNPSDRKSRFMARQTDSSSSTMAISGLLLLKGSILRALRTLLKKARTLRFNNLLRDQSRADEEVCILDLSPIGRGTPVEGCQVSGVRYQARLSQLRNGFVILSLNPETKSENSTLCRFPRARRCAPVRLPNPR